MSGCGQTGSVNPVAEGSESECESSVSDGWVGGSKGGEERVAKVAEGGCARAGVGLKRRFRGQRSPLDALPAPPFAFFAASPSAGRAKESRADRPSRRLSQFVVGGRESDGLALTFGLFRRMDVMAAVLLLLQDEVLRTLFQSPDVSLSHFFTFKGERRYRL